MYGGSEMLEIVFRKNCFTPKLSVVITKESHFNTQYSKNKLYDSKNEKKTRIYKSVVIAIIKIGSNVYT